jgi:hypothetical protein
MTIEYVDVVKRFPLWASIPLEARITEADLRRRHPNPHPYMAKKLDERLKILEAPACELATHWLEYHNTKWAPCVYPVAEGQHRCRRHGGDPVVKPAKSRSARVADLEAEVAHLRALLADTPSPTEQRDA